jgi:hypothetical protein
MVDESRVGLPSPAPRPAAANELCPARTVKFRPFKTNGSPGLVGMKNQQEWEYNGNIMEYKHPIYKYDIISICMYMHVYACICMYM